MPTLKQAHLQFAQANRTTPKLQKSLLSQRTTKHLMDRQTTYREERRHNSGFAKKRVQWLIEHSTSHQILWYVDSLVLRNPLLRKAANR
jgi:hypothetical protein